MPLYGGGNKNKRKGTRRGQGNAQKAGVKGVAAQYITRNKAIKKLQISLKDFRRLCILKGIYPRDPRKKKEGKDKTYYHIKDIQYLQHEPLLVKFRELKTFLKKYKKALARKEWTRAKTLEENKPQFTLQHLIRERYPTFLDALRDLDDPLSMVHLFANLPSEIQGAKNQHTPDKSFDCEKLAAEWERIVIQTKTLRKVFVSIKGIYYQAKVQGQDIIWLVPHQFNQVLPEDVDYRVMLTFLQFYSELLRFVNFKLYHDAGLNYPPQLDAKLYEKRAGIKSLQVQQKEEGINNSVKKEEGAEESAPAAPVVDAQAKKALQKSVSQVVNKLKKEKKQKGADAMETDEQEDVKDEEEENTDDFAALTGQDRSKDDLSNKTPDELDAYYAARVFEGCTFLLSREVPHASLEFVILCGGGKVESERDLTPEEAASPRFTHQIVDRPTIRGDKLSTREYIQPQWVYDSFNSYNAVPVAPYAVGKVPPPHLSPFVKEEQEAELEAMHEAGQGTVYIPEQRKQLQKWGAKASWLATKIAQDKKDAAALSGDAEEEDAEAELEEEEARHAREIALEREGKSHSEHVEEQQQAADAKKSKKGKKAQQAEEEEEEDEEVDEDDGEGEMLADSDDEEDAEEEEEEEEEAAPAATRTSSRKRKAADTANDPEELAKAMMTKKDARLYGRMMYGIDKKKEQVNKLEQKRKQIEKEEKQTAKKQKTASKKK